MKGTNFMGNTDAISLSDCTKRIGIAKGNSVKTDSEMTELNIYIINKMW